MQMKVQHIIFAFIIEGENRYLNLVNVHLGINFPLPWREGIKGRGTQSQSVARKYFWLCAMRIFTPTLTLPRQGGGDLWSFRLDEGAAKSPSIPSPRRRIYEPEAFTKGGRF